MTSVTVSFLSVARVCAALHNSSGTRTVRCGVLPDELAGELSGGFGSTIRTLDTAVHTVRYEVLCMYTDSNRLRVLR